MKRLFESKPSKIQRLLETQGVRRTPRKIFSGLFLHLDMNFRKKETKGEFQNFLKG